MSIHLGIQRHISGELTEEGLARFGSPDDELRGRFGLPPMSDDDWMEELDPNGISATTVPGLIDELKGMKALQTTCWLWRLQPPAHSLGPFR